MSETEQRRPARGTRPANRRELIVAAAGELFYREGFGSVGVGQIAAEVAVTPSALYRHFRNKHELLYAVIDNALTMVEDILNTVGRDNADPVPGLARAALEHRRIGVLWRREARHLDPPVRGRVNARIRTIATRLADLLQRRRGDVTTGQAELLAWAVLGSVTSISFHRLTLPPQRYSCVLAEIITAIADTTLPAVPPTAPAGVAANPWFLSRRDEILSAAVRLFDRDGYTRVAVEDIGNAIGIAGASIYNHFAAKTDILTELLDRGAVILRGGLYRTLGRAGGPADALRLLVGDYTEFGLENPALVGILTAEINQLGSREQHRARATQHEYVDAWEHLMRRVHPESDPVECRIRVLAFMGVVNSIAGIPRLRTRTGTRPTLLAVAEAILGLPTTGPGPALTADGNAG